MARITGTLKYVTTRPEDVKRASVRAPRAREYDGAVITTSTDYVDIVGGRLEFDAAPGPVVVTLLRARGPVEVLELIVPEGGGSLADAVGAAELADSATRSQLERLSVEAIEAVRESQEAASSAKESLGELKELESNAEGLLNSAAEAASRAEQIVGSTSWDNDVLTVNGKSSPPLTGPRGPRGEPGERGPTGERGPAGVDGATTWAGIGGKPAKFPPQDHEHVSADISDAVGYFGSPGFGNRVVKTHPSGHLHDANDPSEDNQLARKGYVDSVGNQKADKTHKHKVADITDIPAIDYRVTGGVLVRRLSSGQITVPETPGGNGYAASKKYVDDTAFPLSIETIPGGKDLDTYTKTGVFHQNMDRDARSGTNYPPDTGAGLLEVFNPDGGMTYQRYTRYGNNNRVWTRGLYNGTWSSWKMSAQDGHTHTSAEISDAVEAYVLKADGNNANRLIRSDSRGRITVQDAHFQNTETAVVNRRYVDSRIQVVSSLPSKPESDVLYVIPE